MPTMGLGLPFFFSAVDKGVGKMFKLAQGGFEKLTELASGLGQSFDTSRLGAFKTMLEGISFDRISNAIDHIANNFNKGLNAGDTFGEGMGAAMAKVKASLPPTAEAARDVSRAMKEVMPMAGFQNFEGAAQMLNAFRKAGFDLKKTTPYLQDFAGAAVLAGGNTEELATALGNLLPVYDNNLDALRTLTDRVVTYGRSIGAGQEITASFPKILNQIRDSAHGLGETLSPELFEKRTMSILALGRAFQNSGDSAGDAETKALELFKVLQEKRVAIKQIGAGMQEGMGPFEDVAKSFAMAGVDIGQTFDLLESDPFNFAANMQKVYGKLAADAETGLPGAQQQLDRFHLFVNQTFGADMAGMVTKGAAVFEGASKDISAAYGNVAGAARKAGKTAMEGSMTMSQALEAAKAAYEARLNKISGITAAVLVKETTQRYKHAGDILEKYTSDGMGKLGQLLKVAIGVQQRGFIALTMSAGPAGKAFGAFAGMAAEAASSMMPLVTAFGALGFRLGDVPKLFTAPIGAIRALGAALVGLVGWPALIVGGLVGLGALLSSGFDTELKSFGSGIPAMLAKDVAPFLLTALDDVFGKKASTAIARFFGLAVEQGTSPEVVRGMLIQNLAQLDMSKAGDFLMTKITELFSFLGKLDYAAMGTTLAQWFSKGLGFAMSMLHSVGEGVMNALVSLVTGSTQKASTPLGAALGSMFKGLAMGVWSTLKELVGQAIGYIAEDPVKRIASVLSMAFGGPVVVGAVSAAVDALMETAFGASVAQSIAQVGDTVGGFFARFEDTWTMLSSLALTLWDALKYGGLVAFTMVEEGIQKVANFFFNLYDTAMKIWTDITTLVQEFGITVDYVLETLGVYAWIEQVKNGFAIMADWIMAKFTAVQAILAAFYGRVGLLIREVMDRAKAMFMGVTEIMSTMANAVVATWGLVSSVISAVFSRVLQGIRNVAMGIKVFAIEARLAFQLFGITLTGAFDLAGIRIKNFFEGMISRARASMDVMGIIFKSFGHGVVSLFKTVFGDMPSLAEMLTDSSKRDTFFKGLGDKVKNVFAESMAEGAAEIANRMNQLDKEEQEREKRVSDKMQEIERKRTEAMSAADEKRAQAKENYEKAQQGVEEARKKREETDALLKQNQNDRKLQEQAVQARNQEKLANAASDLAVKEMKQSNANRAKIEERAKAQQKAADKSGDATVASEKKKKGAIDQTTRAMENQKLAAGVSPTDGLPTETVQARGVTSTQTSAGKLLEEALPQLNASGAVAVTQRAAKLVGNQQQLDDLVNVLGFQMGSRITGISAGALEGSGSTKQGLVVTLEGDVKKFVRLSEVRRATQGANVGMDGAPTPGNM